ncbi:MAG: 4Fe-4S dicluster domain-containing protein [Nitrospirota bacterium]
MKKSLLIDISKCLACHSCTVACKSANGVTKWSFRTFVHPYESGTYPNVRINYAKHSCKHCKEPACVTACPVQALYRTEEGSIEYNSKKCIGCRYCMYACPFSVPLFDWHKSQIEKPLIQKCDFCAHRVDGGKGLACAQACPFGALTEGELDKMLKEARSRIKNRPDFYINHIYGQEEVGGTSVIYLSSRPFGEVGLADVGTKPVTTRSETSMTGMLPGVTILALFLAGIRWVSHRREELSKGKEE